MVGEVAELQRRASLEEALEYNDNNQEDGGRTLHDRRAEQRAVPLNTQASLLPL